MRLPGIKPIPRSAAARLGGLLLTGGLLTGCGGGDFGDLQTFMNEVDARPAPPIAPLRYFRRSRLPSAG